VDLMLVGPSASDVLFRRLAGVAFVAPPPDVSQNMPGRVLAPAVVFMGNHGVSWRRCLRDPLAFQIERLSAPALAEIPLKDQQGLSIDMLMWQAPFPGLGLLPLHGGFQCLEADGGERVTH